jgi:hypothetical protein
MPDAQPLVALDGSGTPSILNYNVPEPTSYTGRNLIQLNYDKSYFKELIGTEPAPPSGRTWTPEYEKWLSDRVLRLPTSSRQIDQDLPHGPVIRLPEARMAAAPEASRTSAAARTMVQADIAKANVEAGKVPVPGIYLVETHRVSNFLGDYGAGKTVQTFSLLPGEKTKISIKTYKTTETSTSSTKSIFDSYSTTAANEFQDTIESENSHTESKEKTSEWYVDAEASCNWGVASASVAGGASGSTNSAREDFASNVSSATNKHAQTASAQRDVSVNTTSTESTTSGEETAIEREIQNINVGRTLNFVFRQLNQEHISLLHLVDVRVGFFNGYPDKTMEVPIHELKTLLDYCVATREQREEIEKEIYYILSQVRNHLGDAQDVLVERSYREQNGNNKRIKMMDRRLRSTYEPQGRNITVDGVILSATKVVLRTDALIVEALVGAATALDDYSSALQDEKVKQQVLTTRLMALEAEERTKRLEVLNSKDAAAAEIYQTLFQPPPAPETES